MNDEGTLESNESRREAIVLARRTIGWSLLVVYLVVVVPLSIIAEHAIKAGIYLGLLPFLLATIFGGKFAGWFARYWFWRSGLSVPRMAVTFSLLLVSALCG